MLTVAVLMIAQASSFAGQISEEMPILLNPGSIITTQDYPQESLRKNEFGVASIVIGVSQNGRASSCEVTESTGFPTLDQATCNLFKERSRFRQDDDVAGEGNLREYRTSVAWGVEGHWSSTLIEFPLQVSRIPADYRSPVNARITFDQSGRMRACAITKSSGSDEADKVVCAYAKDQIVINPPKGTSSNSPAMAIRFLQSTLSLRSNSRTKSR